MFYKLFEIIKKKKFTILLIFFLVLTYQFFFSPTLLNILIPKLITTKDLEIKFSITKSSIFTGFEIQNLMIFDNITHEPIILAKKIKLLYFLPGFFLGHIGIREFTVEEPKIYIIQKNQRWNYESLLPKVYEETEKPQEPIPEKIKTYLPLKFYAYLNIKNLEFTYKIETIEQKKSTILELLEIKELSFVLGVITKSFKEIPFNTNLLNLLDDFLIYINPKQKFFLTYQKNETITGSPIVSINLIKASEENLKFISDIILNTNGLNFSKNKKIISLSTELNCKIDYLQETNEFLIQEISLKNESGYLFFLKGIFKKIEDDWFLELEQQKDQVKMFSLDIYGNILNLITNNTIFLKGNLFLKELFFKGKLSELKTKIYLNSDLFRFNEHQINQLQLEIESTLNLKKPLSFLYEESPKETQEEKIAFGIIRELQLKNLSLLYNQALINLKGNIEKQINIYLSVSQFNLGMFLEPHLRGYLNGSVLINSNLELNQIQFHLDAGLQNTQFFLDNYASKPFLTNLKGNGLVEFFNSTNLQIEIQELSLQKLNKENPILEISGNTKLFFGKHLSKYSIQLNNLQIHYTTLYEHLPNNLKETINSYKNFLEQGVNLIGNFELEFGNQNSYLLNLALKLPSLHKDVIFIKTNISQDPKRMIIHLLSLEGWYNSIILKIKGRVEKKNHWNPDLKLFLQYQYPQYLEIYKNLFLKGRILLEVHLFGNTTQGNLILENLSTKFVQECDKQNKNLCKYFEILNASLKLPFSLELNQQTFISYHSKDILKIPNKNFLIEGIRSNYSLDNLYFAEGFYFLGSKEKNALEGFIEIKNNIIWIPYLELFSYFGQNQNGTIMLKNFYFNLSDFDPKHLELEGNLNIINFDLNSLFPKAESIFKGVISSFVYFRIQNFSDIIRNTFINVSIYQISKDFAGFLVRIIAPSIIAITVNNTLIIKSIDLELINGLVYSNIRVQNRGLFSLSKIIQPESEEIKQERIPLAEFLKKSEEEIQTMR